MVIVWVSVRVVEKGTVHVHVAVVTVLVEKTMVVAVPVPLVALSETGVEVTKLVVVEA